jgi:hypothetical protein
METALNTGTSDWVTGKLGSALQFNGSNALTLASGGDGQSSLGLWNLATGAMRIINRQSARHFLAWNPSGTVLIAGKNLKVQVINRQMFMPRAVRHNNQ